MPPSTVGGGTIMCSGRPSVRPFFCWQTQYVCTKWRYFSETCL